jgi:type I restriction-modification system DNA methylase subunit
MGIVLPHGVLFRGAQEGKIRRTIIEDFNLLDAVIGLPANLFFGAGIPACVLIFKKNRANRNVFFIDASGEGNYEKGKNQNILREQDIEKIVKTYRKRKAISKYSYNAAFDEIKSNDFKELKEHGLLQAIARANRLYDGKDYGLVVDYRGLISKLDDAMEMYSGAGMDNFDGNDLKGAVVDVIACVGKVRETYSRLLDVFSALRDSCDTEELEVHNALCEFGKALSMALNSEKVYEALGKDEVAQYKQTFIFFSKMRRSVKIRYADASVYGYRNTY